ncbi:cation-translocating P-type ATPase [Lactococcus termiticola]|uniref:P-type Ca(2+) transporter n=1 Tax=Lactococcus termiticola TaxID=2169526 RepID=A0A2R5HHQ1_9LACT|nr:cation-translocating P-type ATPase [Lactococcus termiticola]GBG97512.1 cation-transporting ATPase [Lactococcus termiticola]
MEKEVYKQTVDEVMEELDSGLDGLSQAEVKARLEQYGYNELAAGKKKSLLVKFLEQFKDLMIIILVLAAVLSVVTSRGHEWSDAAIIMLVVIINAIFGVYQEGKAEAAIEALKEMNSPAAHVKRAGQVQEIDSRDLVPGDIVLLEAGNIVPADLRLLESASLKMEEAALTGESVPVEKTADAEVADGAPLGDRLNMAYQNANVTYGRGLGMVVATGMATEVGKIASMIEAADETETPLKANLNKLSKVLTWAILGIAAITFIVHLLRGGQILEGLLVAVALAVAAIPEGLPAIVTIVLAMGTQLLAKQKAIVRKLPAVETLGSTDIIASDKTGTLTMNQMTVEELWTGDLGDADLSLRIMNFANDSKISNDGQLLGDPTETALVKYGQEQAFDLKAELAATPRIAELPFDSDRKLMTTVHQMADGRLFVATKGAPDRLLERCLIDDRSEIVAVNSQLAQQALRVLMMAYKWLDELPEDLSQLEEDLQFAGLVGMIDPERPEAGEAVATAKKAGIRPIMITGDHQDTAEAIAKRLGIIEASDQENHVLTGQQLDELSQEAFAEQVGQYLVYARVSPEHKVRIVKAWQNQEKVVAMTGDGVNDAPALKQADIGIGMGITGTEVSKGAADMVLADDNFATIITAVKAGRKVFANIQKTIQYLLSANTAEVLTIFTATLMGWDVLLPVHLLWINLVTDTFPAIALGLEPDEPGMMEEAPRGKKANFFSGGVLSSTIYQGILQAALTLGVYGLALAYPVHAGQPDLMHADALTMAFATLGLIQLFHAFNVKSIHQSIFKLGAFKNKTFNGAVLLSFVLLAMVIAVPGMNDIFHVSNLDAYQWAIVLVASFSILVIVELVKFFQRKFLKL